MLNILLDIARRHRVPLALGFCISCAYGDQE